MSEYDNNSGLKHFMVHIYIRKYQLVGFMTIEFAQSTKSTEENVSSTIKINDKMLLQTLTSNCLSD